MYKISCLFLLLLICSCSGSREKEDRSEPEASANDLPEIQLMLESGTRNSTRNLSGNVALILFQPDCDHCQREAQQIQQNLEHFKEWQLYFISAAPMEEVIRFAEEYNLKGNSRIKFATTSVSEILNSFGPIEAPSIYLYSKSKLVKSFHGEVEVSEIIKHL
jgi:thiol-disulfide isomerase/thioredoxin